MRLDYDYDLKKRTPRGYIASTSLRIRQDDLSKLATVLDVASLLDVDGLSDLRFRYHLTQADYDLALTRAVKAALHKAELIAVAYGQRLSSIQEIRQKWIGWGCCNGADGNVGRTTGEGIHRTRKRDDFKNHYDGN